MPDPYATPSQARTYYAGEDASGVLLDVPMRQAARLVQEFAPAPDPVTADYEESAVDAELEIGRFLSNSLGGSLSSLTSPEGGLSFTNMAAVKSIIGQTMGSYATVGRVRMRLLERG